MARPQLRSFVVCLGAASCSDYRKQPGEPLVLGTGSIRAAVEITVRDSLALNITEMKGRMIHRIVTLFSLNH
jgi:hypothetical protein